MNKNRKLKLDNKYMPFPAKGELYADFIFRFNITGMLEIVMSGKIDVQKERINVKEWFKTQHVRGSV